MEPQPPSSRKRKRSETQDIFEEKITNLSLDDFPTPPGVNSFAGVDGQKFAQPRDAGSATDPKKAQAGTKRSPITDEEMKELHKLNPLSEANLAKHNSVLHGLADIARWKTMSTKQIEDLMPDVEDYCVTEREKIRTNMEAVEECSRALESMKRRCARWQREVDFQENALHRAKAFLRQREIEEATANDKEPARKKRRMG
ncbi:hypothetical protein ACLOAV_003076 [Pseudogymnoascus australis]